MKAKVEKAKAEKAKAEQAKVEEKAKAEKVKAEKAKVEKGKAEKAKAEQAKKREAAQQRILVPDVLDDEVASLAAEAAVSVKPPSGIAAVLGNKRLLMLLGCLCPRRPADPEPVRIRSFWR